MNMTEELEQFRPADWMAVIGCIMHHANLPSFTLTPDLWETQVTDDSRRHMLVARLPGGGIEIKFATSVEAEFFRQTNSIIPPYEIN